MFFNLSQIEMRFFGQDSILRTSGAVQLEWNCNFYYISCTLLKTQKPKPKLFDCIPLIGQVNISRVLYRSIFLEIRKDAAEKNTSYF